MAKPTGVSGFFQVQIDAHGHVIGSFEQIAFSAKKAEVEKHMAERFIVSMNKHLEKTGGHFFLADPRNNEEDDFDFTVSTPNGPAYLELMEIAPMTGPYDSVPAKYKPYDFGQTIFSGILEKSAHYPKNVGRDIFLLLYITHWSFALSDRTLACLRYWLKAQPTVFRAIFTYEPLDSDEGRPHWLFPVPPELIGSFDPEQVRENVCLNLSPQKWEIVRERKS